MLCKLQKGDWKKIDKQAKDMLTFDYMSGILTKLFDGDEVNESGAWGTEKFRKKNLKKIWKKYLTNETEPDIIVTVPLEGRAPCKLNNVRKESTSGASFSRGSRRSCGWIGRSQFGRKQQL